MPVISKQELTDRMDDIISSGDGEFTEWHQDELTELFDGVDDKEQLRAIVVEYYNESPEGATLEEINWVAQYFGKKAQIDFI